jgi:hypothetical protein
MSVFIAICKENLSILSDVGVVTFVIAFLRQWPHVTQWLVITYEKVDWDKFNIGKQSA